MSREPKIAVGEPGNYCGRSTALAESFRGGVGVRDAEDFGACAVQVRQASIGGRAPPRPRRAAPGWRCARRPGAAAPRIGGPSGAPRPGGRRRAATRPRAPPRRRPAGIHLQHAAYSIRAAQRHARQRARAHAPAELAFHPGVALRVEAEQRLARAHRYPRGAAAGRPPQPPERGDRSGHGSVDDRPAIPERNRGPVAGNQDEGAAHDHLHHPPTVRA
jgi:hypothetical protein